MPGDLLAAETTRAKKQEATAARRLELARAAP
jgi:hypothetical protein